ncbi:MAG TPA: hypothetical protein VHY48_10740 [Acidobacteriaceae bacterium]|jgi:hypothetical protein|nr:hypothetical protein [Acidobacteriaceae bacterium]
MRDARGADRIWLIWLILVKHFFRRFFDNDTIQVEGETQTTVVRAFAIVAMPGMMFAFWLQNQYPQRPVWGAIGDQYFFVLFSFVVMGMVAIVEWEMLFPDRMDFVILSPLPLKTMQMPAAKVAALGGFFGLFLVGCNLCGMMMLPAIATHVAVVNGKARIVGDFWRQAGAHGAAVMMAGVFAALLFLAIGGVLLCVLSATQFRVISPVVQMLSVAALVLLMVQYARYGDAMQAMLSGPVGRLRWVPPLWFLGVYEQMLHGPAAPAFAREMARYAMRGTAAVGAVAVATYPVAWVRMRRMAVEGGMGRRRRAAGWMARLFNGVLRRPGERAVFHFVEQTMARNNRYQVYLAVYGGTGLALATACAVGYRVSGGGGQFVLSREGLHAVMPLLLFWVIAGLRTAFAFPLNLGAAWVFRITGVSMGECAAAARRWVLLCAMGVMGCVLGLLWTAGWSGRALLVQAVCGMCLSVLLTDGFFFFQRSVPFTRPRMPGKTSLPLMLTLYIGILPLFLLGMVKLEMLMELHLMRLLVAAAIAAAIHGALTLMRESGDEIEEEMEGYEGEFQLLGLAGH